MQILCCHSLPVDIFSLIPAIDGVAFVFRLAELVYCRDNRQLLRVRVCLRLSIARIGIGLDGLIIKPKLVLNRFLGCKSCLVGVCWVSKRKI